MKMDEILFRSHLETPDFLIGLSKDQWGFISEEKDWPEWPIFFFWIKAPIEKGPDRYVLKFELTNYNQQAPQGIFWDDANNCILPPGKRPKVTGVYERAFRVDWQQGRELYAPWDRSGLKAHPDWKVKHTSDAWDCGKDEIAKYLRIVYLTLNSESYHGTVTK
jgi:hypothetical protein